MTKLFAFLTAICLFFTIPVAHATTNQKVQKIGIVIVGNASYKTPHYYRLLNRKFVSKENPNVTFESSEHLQNKYMSFWASKGFLAEQPLTEETLLEFVKFSEYDKILYLEVGDIDNGDYQNNYRSTRVPYYPHTKTGFILGIVGDLLENREKVTHSLGIAAVFCDEEKIINKYEIEKENTSMLSANERAETSKNDLRENIVRKCVNELAPKVIKDVNLS